MTTNISVREEGRMGIKDLKFRGLSHFLPSPVEVALAKDFNEVVRRTRIDIMRDYKELVESIRIMTPRYKLFKVLKKELTARGYWKNHPRGNPKKGYAASHKKERLV